MPLHKIKEFDPDYRNHFDNQDIIGYDLYSGKEKVGSVDDILVDESGNFRYLIINTGVWILGKKVLLPIGRAQLNHAERSVFVSGLTKASVEELPEYDANSLNSYDYDYEERVRGAYRPLATGALENAAPINSRDQLDYDRNTYAYDRDPGLYDLNDRDHQNIKLYQERLIANKTRQKTGEVAVGKHVETETQRVSVPIEKERVVIERVAGNTTAAVPGEAAFNDAEVARVEVYEETPDIRKEAFVREEVRVSKEVDRETVNAEEQLRREELDVDTQGNPVVRGTDDLPPKRR